MKLQQLQNNPATKLHHARVDTKTGQAASKPLQGERVAADLFAGDPMRTAGRGTIRRRLLNRAISRNPA